MVTLPEILSLLSHR